MNETHELTSFPQHFVRHDSNEQAFLIGMVLSQDTYAFIPDGYHLVDHHVTLDEKPKKNLFHRSKTYRRETETIKLHVYYNHRGDIDDVLVSERDENNTITQTLAISEHDCQTIRRHECLKENDTVKQIMCLTHEEYQRQVQEIEQQSQALDHRFSDLFDANRLEDYQSSVAKLAKCETTANALHPNIAIVRSKLFQQGIDFAKKRLAQAETIQTLDTTPIEEESLPAQTPVNITPALQAKNNQQDERLKIYQSLVHQALKNDKSALQSYYQQRQTIQEFMLIECFENYPNSSKKAITTLQKNAEKIMPVRDVLEKAIIEHDVDTYCAVINYCIEDPFIRAEHLFFSQLMDIQDSETQKVTHACQMLDLLFKENDSYLFILSRKIGHQQITLDTPVGYTTFMLKSLTLLEKLLSHGLSFNSSYVENHNLLLHPSALMWECHLDEEGTQYTRRLDLLHRYQFNWGQHFTSCAPEYLKERPKTMASSANALYSLILSHPTKSVEVLRPANRSLSLLLLGALHAMPSPLKLKMQANRARLFTFIVRNALSHFPAWESLMAAMTISHNATIGYGIDDDEEARIHFEVHFNKNGNEAIKPYYRKFMKRVQEYLSTSTDALQNCLNYLQGFLPSDGKTSHPIFSISAIRSLWALETLRPKTIALDLLVKSCIDYYLLYSGQVVMPKEMMNETRSTPKNRMHYATIAHDLADALPDGHQLKRQASHLLEEIEKEISHLTPRPGR